MTTIAESPRNERTQRLKRIELAISPGRSLGPFRLGKEDRTSLFPLFQVIQHLFPFQVRRFGTPFNIFEIDPNSFPR